MNSNATIKVLLRSTHLHRNTETLQHLTNTETQNVQTDHLLLGSGTDHLHLSRVLVLFLSGEDVVEHGRELGVVDLDLVGAVPLAGFGLSETD